MSSVLEEPDEKQLRIERGETSKTAASRIKATLKDDAQVNPMMSFHAI